MENKMPRVRQMNVGEVDLLGLWVAQSQINALKRAFSEGKNVQVEESSFKDPQDYVQVLVDGQPFTYIPGY
jgi:hypothetical protein